MVAPSGNKDTLYANLRHEYAHYHLRKQGLYYPPWFDEGMASLFEHVQVERDGNARLDSDRLFSRYAEPLRESGQLSFQRLLSATTFQHWSLQRLQRFYGLSGQLVHFFEFAPERGFTDRREQLQNYLASGAHDLPASLGISTRQLEGEFRRYRSASGKPKPAVTLDQRL